MKTISFFSNTQYAFFGLLLLCCNCKSNDPIEANSGSINYITAVTETSKSSGSESVGERKYLYDEQMRLKEINYSYQHRFTSGASQLKIKNMQTFSYYSDTNNLLMKKMEFETREDISTTQTTTIQKQITTRYTYLNERLREEVMQQSITKAGAVETTSLKTAYEYDEAGKPTKKTTIDGKGAQTVWTFVNGQLTDIVQQSAEGTEMRPFTIKNGMLERETYNDGRYAQYEYDAERRLIKCTLYVDATKINFYYTNSWCTGKSYESTLPSFYGHPDIPAFMGKNGVLAKYTFFGDVNGKLVQLNESNYVNEFNEDGFVKNTVLQNQQFGTMATDPVYVINTNTTYSYLKK